MFPDMFRSVDLMARGLEAAQARQDTIANNIANVDTPGFQSSHVEFESYMQAALQDEGGLQAKTTRDRHIAFGAASEASAVQPAVVPDGEAASMRVDGNNVDIDAQMTELARNTIWYNALVNNINGELDRLRIAIDGR